MEGQAAKRTVNEMGNDMLDFMHWQRASTGKDDAARDLSLAITHLEDALTRYNSAQYRIKGTWKRADPDKSA